MGCIPSKLNIKYQSDSNSTDSNGDSGKTYSWEKKKNVDPTKYTLENLIDSEDGRLPGEINGEQFIIQNCESSRIYLFDDINTITIDDCTHCSIFVGPVAGSIFIRNCKNCIIAVACGQFRSRDCHKIDTFLYCQSQPIIESSTKMKFSCFQCNYPELTDQFKRSNLNIFNNNWANVHDFTSVEGEDNWFISKTEDLSRECFPMPKKPEFMKVGLTLKSDASLVPLTSGVAHSFEKDACLIICFFNDKYHENAIDITSKMLKDKFTIQCTNELKMEKSEVHRFFGGSFLGKMAQRGPVVALLCTGSGVVEQCKKTACMLNAGKKNPVVYTTDGSGEGLAQIDLFFCFAQRSGAW